MKTDKAAIGLDRDLLRELVRGAKKTLENAEALFHEAKILSAAGALSRGLFLHQISLEECAKIETLGEWATSIIAGHPTDEKKVLEGLTRHANKNRTNAYLLTGSAEEKSAIERGDWDTARSEFKQLQGEFHSKSNAMKNASLYVDFEDRKFAAPLDRITADMLAETAALNETFLALAYPKLRMLVKWEEAPEEAQKTIIAFMEAAEVAKTRTPKEALAEIGKLIDKFAETDPARSAVRGDDNEPDV